MDVPKDIQQQLAVPDWDAPMAIAGYMSRLPPPPEAAQVDAVVQALHEVQIHRTSGSFGYCGWQVACQACVGWQERTSMSARG